MKFNQEIENKIDKLFTKHTNDKTPGFAVGIVHKEEFVYKKGFGHANLEHFSPINSETVFHLASVAKSFTGMAIALLEEQGHLKVDESIRKYLPELPVIFEEVTILNLLHHTSGIFDYCGIYHGLMGYRETDAPTIEEGYDLICKMKKLNFKPGEQYEYSNSNYSLLSLIIKKVTGKTIGEYAEENIFKPLGMNRTFYRENYSKVIPNKAEAYCCYPVMLSSPCDYDRNHEGYKKVRSTRKSPDQFFTFPMEDQLTGDTGVWSCLDDLKIWAENYQNNRLGSGTKLLEKIIPKENSISDGMEKYGYGVGAGISKSRNMKYYYHTGADTIYSALFMVFPEEETSIIALCNREDQGMTVLNLVTSFITNLIYPIASNNDQSKNNQNPTVTLKQEFKRCIGVYHNLDENSTMEICFDKNKGLYVFQGSRRIDLEYLDNWNFKSINDSANMIIEFEYGNAEKSTGFTIEEYSEKQNYRRYDENTLTKDELLEYTGEYYNEQFDVTYYVKIFENALKLENKNKLLKGWNLKFNHISSDTFNSFDPFQEWTNIVFHRENDKIVSFCLDDSDFIFYRRYLKTI